MFHKKLEHQFAISWGLFHFHTYRKSLPHLAQNAILFIHLPPTNRITTPFIGGRKVLITPLRNTLYNHLPLSNNHIVSYIYTNYHPPPTIINHNHPFTYKYHALTIKPPKNNRTLYRINLLNYQVLKEYVTKSSCTQNHSNPSKQAICTKKC